jgi:hypothetical protein
VARRKRCSALVESGGRPSVRGGSGANRSAAAILIAGGRRRFVRVNRVRLREIGRMVDVRPSCWAAEVGGGRRRCLVVAGCGGGWRGSLGERGGESICGRGKMKRNQK